MHAVCKKTELEILGAGCQKWKREKQNQQRWFSTDLQVLNSKR